MSDDRTLPFSQRAYKNFRFEMAELAIIEKQMKEEEEAYKNEERYREPLAITDRKEVTIELSAGGPADGYKIYFDPSGEPIEGFYYFADWFEYEEEKLSNDELDRVMQVYNVSSYFL